MLDIICFAMWFIWRRRNERVFDGKTRVSVLDWDVIALHLHEFQIHQTPYLAHGKTSRTSNPSLVQIHWIRLEAETFKLNVDGSMTHFPSVVGLGGVIRDHEGLVYGAFTRCLEGSSHLKWRNSSL
ncbi:hypothetical protein Sjap_005177 [Stephania japonica]|uniref:RNase H type-1 domain-containing protein n=1 Tax=Stephania japonica TaxID=461633 RepID=A0AAP0K4Z8_9MAGN